MTNISKFSDVYIKTKEKIKQILSELKIMDTAIFDYNLSLLSPIKTGGKCACFLKINSKQKLIKLINILLKENVKFYIVGNCSNILFNDGFLNFLIIKLDKGFDKIEVLKGKQALKIKCGPAVNLQKFIIYLADFNVDFSFAAGIPGTVGGAVIGNSGSNKIGINDFVKKIEYISLKNISNHVLNNLTSNSFNAFFKDNNKSIDSSCNNNFNFKIANIKTKTLNNKDYKYRALVINDLLVLTGVYFELDFSIKQVEYKNFILGNNKIEILNNIRKKIKEKKASQPVRRKSLGCFFKNPSDSIFAGKLIEDAGFKGFKFGDAKVSLKHANYLLNVGNASSQDILTLSKIIKYYIKEKYNINLEYEIKLMGF